MSGPLRVALTDNTALVFDAIGGGHRHVSQGVLLSIEEATPGQVASCVVIPLEKARAVVSALRMAIVEAGER